MRLAAIAASLAALLPAAAQAADRGMAPPADGRPVPGEVLVGFEPGTGGSQRAAARQAAGVTIKRALRVQGVQLVAAGRGETIDAAIARLERDPRVRYAEPNRWRTRQATPNDPLFGQLWGLNNTGQTVDGVAGTADADIDAPAAWDIFTGGSTLVAVVDEGVAYDHPDLAPNIWTNPGEVAGNGIDDDGNGFADDVHGFDFADDDPDPRDFGGHGTHVAGTIAARGDNGFGVTGVTWTARLMAVRGLGPLGGTDDDIADAFEYAADNGARVVNASLGGPGNSSTLRAPIQGHPETLFVVAAGNDGKNNDPVTNASEFPCSFPDTNLICVAATTQSDGLASFSNFGATSVDLGAPGTNVVSTKPFVGMSEGFELNDFAGRWDAHVDVPSTNPPASSFWGRTGASASSGTFSIADSPGGDYANSTVSLADLMTPVDLRGASGCVLTFKARYALGSGDKFVVDRSVNGWQTFTRIRDNVTGTSNGLYESFQLPLAADGQPEVVFGFGLISDASGRADGINVDDVAVTCTAPGPSAAQYQVLDGTSMATPHVAGAAALLFGRNPSLTAAQVRSILLATGDQRTSLGGKTFTGRRLNVNNAIRDPLVGPAPSPSPDPDPSPSPSPSPSATPTATATATPTATATATPTATATVTPGGGTTTPPPGGGITTPPPGGGASTAPTVAQLTGIAKRSRVTCKRSRGLVRCRITGAGARTVRLMLKKGARTIASGSGRADKRIALSGRTAKPGRYKVVVTVVVNGVKGSATKRVTIR